MACKDCVYVRKPMRGFYNQVYCNYLHIHVSDQPYYDASKRCNGYKTKQTNADRIRSMTDEEMAGFMFRTFGKAAWCMDNKCPPEESCVQCWLDWLKQAADMEEE